MSVGDHIKNARKSAGITQKELAEKCGAAEITIRQYESNKREPRNEQLMKIARILNVELYDLLGYTAPEQKEHVQKARSQETVLQYMESLNGSGQAEAIRLVELLTKIPEYKKERK